MVMATSFVLLFLHSPTLSHVDLGKKEERVFIPLSFLFLAGLGRPRARGWRHGRESQLFMEEYVLFICVTDCDSHDSRLRLIWSSWSSVFSLNYFFPIPQLLVTCLLFCLYPSFLLHLWLIFCLHPKLSNG